MNTSRVYTYQSRFVRFFAGIVDFFGGIFFFRLRKSRLVEQGAVRKILVVKLDHIGDAFMMTPFLEALKNIFHDARIDLLAPTWTKEIYEYNPFIGSLFTYDYYRTNRKKNKKCNMRTTIELIKTLRKEKYDLYIDAKGEPFAAFLGWLIGARCRVGFIGDEFGSFFYTHRIAQDKMRYEGEKYQQVLALFHPRNSLPSPKLYPTKKEKEKVDKILIEKFSKKIIALHLAAGVPSRIWPAEKFAELADRLAEKFYDQGIEFAVLGGREDMAYIERFRSLSGVQSHVLAGAFNLREAYYFLSKCALFVGNDSALMRFAAALGIPTIDLFHGSVDIKRWRPVGANVHVIVGRNPAHACKIKDCPYPCPHMQAISVDEVFKIADTILKDL